MTLCMCFKAKRTNPVFKFDANPISCSIVYRKVFGWTFHSKIGNLFSTLIMEINWKADDFLMNEKNGENGKLDNFKTFCLPWLIIDKWSFSVL